MMLTDFQVGLIRDDLKNHISGNYKTPEIHQIHFEAILGLINIYEALNKKDDVRVTFGGEL